MYIKSLIPSNLKTTWRVVAICDSPTECQVDDFLSGLESKLAKQADSMRQMLATAAIHGPQHFPKDICHNIASEIFQFTKGSIRVAWFYDAGKIVVCCQAAIKKGQKTPKQFIKNATDCLQEYRLQKARGNITELPGG